MNKAIVVCGTGIVGLAAAVALARRGVSVGLLGPAVAPPPAQPHVYARRVYAISPASRDFLDAMGVWRALPVERIAPMHAMDVYGDADGHVQLHAWQAAQDALGWIVESLEIERALAQAVHILGIPWLHQTATWQPDGLLLEDGQRLQPQLVVAADGARSRLRGAAGLMVTSKPYGATGLVAHADAELAHGGTACQWFCDGGVLALLPLPDSDVGPQVSIVWSMPDAPARELLALDAQTQAEELSRRLHAVTAGRLGLLRPSTPLAGFPLTLDRTPVIAPATLPSAPALALVGDAAHRVHPLAGQGLNLGLGDVQALAEVIATREPFRAVNDAAVLRRYRRARVEAVAAMALATNGLYRLFDSQQACVAWLRNAGMRWVDRLPGVKRRLIAHASG